MRLASQRRGSFWKSTSLRGLPYRGAATLRSYRAPAFHPPGIRLPLWFSLLLFFCRHQQLSVGDFGAEGMWRAPRDVGCFLADARCDPDFDVRMSRLLLRRFCVSVYKFSIFFKPVKPQADTRHLV